MADQSFRTLLLKFGIKTDDWKAAVSQIKAQLSAIAADEKVRFEAQRKQAQQAVADAKAQAAAQKTVAVELQNQLAQQRLQAAQQRVVEQGVRTRLAQEALVTKQIQNQTAQLRLQQAQQRSAAPKPGGPTGGVGLFGKLGAAATSALGGSFAGGIALGAFAGGGLALIIDKATEAVIRFSEKLHEVVLESGPLSQIHDQFERLAAMKGVDADGFLNKLRTATVGLVADQKLLTLANTGLKSSMNVNEGQMVALTSAVVNLARANGKDAAGAVEALNRFLLTGRAFALSYATGISRAELQTKSFGAGLTDTEKRARTLSSTIELLTSKSAKVGNVPVTVTERFTQLQTSFSNFLEETMLTLGKSEGMKSFVAAIGEAVDWLSKGEQYAKQFGSVLGGVFEVLAQGARLVGSVISDTFGILNTFVNSFVGIFISPDMSSGIASTTERLTSLSGILKTAAEAAVLLRGALDEIALRSKFTIAEAATNLKQTGQWMFQRGVDPNKLHGVADLHAQFEQEMKALQDKEAAELAKLEQTQGGQKSSGTNVFAAGPNSNTTTPPDERILAQIQKAKIAAVQALSKEALAQKKLELEEQKDMEEESYRKGEVSLADHVARMKAINAQLYTAEKKQITDAAAAQKEELEYQVAHGQVAKGAAGFDISKLNAETQTKLLTAQKQNDAQTRALDDKLIADQQAAKQAQAQAQIAIDELRAKAELKTLEKEYKDGLTTTDDYIAQREALLDKELENFKTLKDQELQYHEQTEAEKTKITEEVEKKRADIAEQKAALRQEAPEMELKRTNDQYEGQIRVIEAQIKLQELTGGSRGKNAFGSDSQVSDQQRLISLYKGLNDELEKQIQKVEQGSDAWLKYSAEIIKNKEAIIQTQQAMGSLSGLLGSVFGEIGSAIASLGGRNLGKLAAGFSGAGRIFGAESDFTQYATTRSELQTNSGAPMGLLQGLGSSFKDLIRGFGDSTKNLQNFSRALTDSISSVGTFVSAMQGKGGPLESAVAGAAGGASLGGQAGSALEGVPGLFGMSTALAGPIGMAAGATIGLITGIFSGKAQKKAEEIAKSITDSFNKVIFSLNDGQTTLNQAIKQTEALRQQAVSQLSGKKGGQDQLNKILPQYDQTINQLKAQQAKVLKDFNENLAVLNTGQPYEAEMGSIDAVVQKYQQYIDAGGDVAKANQFLKDSFSDLTKDGLDKLNQDEQDAITNALQYNDLLVQRQQLISSTDQEVFNLLAGGAPSRTQTRAQTTAEKIAQLETQKDLQLEQLNQEIAVAAHKLDVEQQIFNLATTRIGLENQLVNLKNEQTDKDAQNIVALQNVLKVLQGMPSFSGLTTSGAVMQAIIGALGAGVAGNPTAAPTTGTGREGTVIRGTGSGTNFGPRNTDATDMYTNLRLRYAQGLGGYPGVSPSTR